MITVTERSNGTRKVAITFPDDELDLRRLSEDRKGSYEYYVSRSRTKPEFAKDTDLNRIMAKYDKTGIIDPLLYRDMEYGDFTSGKDFTDSMMQVKDALADFANLPAEVRNFFKNDPAQLIDFVDNPANEAEAVKLGLRVAPVITQVFEGNELVTLKDGVEVSRVPRPVPAAAPAPAPGAAAPGTSAGGFKDASGSDQHRTPDGRYA